MDTAMFGWLEEGRTIHVVRRNTQVAPHAQRSTLSPDGTTALVLQSAFYMDASHCDFYAADVAGHHYLVRQYRSELVLPQDDIFAEELYQHIHLPVGECRRAGSFFLVWQDTEATPLSELLEQIPDPIPVDRALVILPPVLRLLEVFHENGLAVSELSLEQLVMAPSLDVSLTMIETPARLGTPLRDVGQTPGGVHPRTFSAFSGVHDMDTEIYAFGTLVWQLLTRQLPPASERTNYRNAVPLRGYRPDLAPGLAPLVEASMSMRPTIAFASPRAFYERLVKASKSAKDLRPHTIRGLEVAAETHIGIAKRHVMPVNQDAIFAASADGDLALLLVSDGVSTADYGSGDIASEFIRAEAFRAWRQVDEARLESTEQRVAFLRHIIERANQSIVDYINEQYAPFSGDPSRIMAATAVLGLVAFGRVTFVSTGDSPAFLVREGKVERINRDHSVLTLSLVAGASVDEILDSGWPDALAACVGTFAIDDTGRLQATPVDIDALEFTLAPNDRLVLCSDGLTDYIADDPATGAEIIRRVINFDSSPAITALELILLGNRGGGGDNVSVVLCYVSDEETPTIVSSEDIYVD